MHCRNGGGESLRTVHGRVKVVLCIQGLQSTASVDRDAQFFKSQSRRKSRKRRMQDAKEGSSFSGLKSSATTFLSFPENKDSVKRRNQQSQGQLSEGIELTTVKCASESPVTCKPRNRAFLATQAVIENYHNKPAPTHGLNR